MQLILNAGSSTLKWALFSSKDADALVLDGVFDGFGDACTFVFGQRTEYVPVRDHREAVEYLLQFLGHNKLLTDPIGSVVHRVVHGGEKYSQPVLVSDAILEDIERLSSLAPLHNPANAAGIRACKKVLPHAAQVAVFDTAFHTSIPKHASLYPLPKELYEKYGIRKYGFHGISHSYITTVLRERYGSDVNAIICHLGSGCSITAVRDGLSVDTTMGFTPTDGVMMGTRSGSIDPEIPVFLLKHGFSPADIEDILTRQSGLLAVTGDKDMRKVWERAQKGDEQARLGLDMFSYRIAYFINALRTAAPAAKAVVFTAGIGEHAWYVRQAVCGILGLPIDDASNKRHVEKISPDGTPVDVLVIPTDEQLQMHRLAKPLV